MFYTRAHVESLERQIEFLKGELSKAREAANPLQAQIVYLQEQLEKSRAECKDLLDRLLLKHNVTPVSEPLPSTKEPIQVLTPFGVLPGEMEDLVKDSWLRTEMEHWMNEGYDETRARQIANDEYLKQHRVIT